MILFALITSLLLTGSAWAGEPCNTCTLIAPGVSECTTLHCVSAEDQLEWDRHQAQRKQNDCLATMEAAMKAMEEFTPKREWPQLSLTSANTLRANIPCVSDDCLKADRLADAENNFAKAQAELDRVKRREDAITQWESTKRECWRATDSPGTP